MDIQKSDPTLDKFILKDDEVLEQFLVNCDRLFAGKRSQVSKKAATDAQHFFKHHVLGHFAYEERYVLPGLLRAGLGNGVSAGVAAIRKDHRALITEVKQLTTLLASAELSGTGLAALREKLLAFGDHLRRHSAMENALFPALV